MAVLAGRPIRMGGVRTSRGRDREYPALTITPNHVGQRVSLVEADDADAAKPAPVLPRAGVVILESRAAHSTSAS